MFSEAFAVAPRPISEMPANLDLRPIGLVLSALEKRHGLAPKGPSGRSSGQWGLKLEESGCFLFLSCSS